MGAHAKGRKSSILLILWIIGICACLLFLSAEGLLAQLQAPPTPTDPAIAEVENTLNRLIALVKGGSSRSEVEAAHTQLRRLIQRLKVEKHGSAVAYGKRAQYLWAEYARGLGKVRDVCPGCPVLDVVALAKGFARPRLLGAGDYTLEDLAEMEENTKTEKPAYKPLITGDFNRDGIMDVALIGRGEQKGKKKLFVLIASPQKGNYRRLFLQPLDRDKAALTVKDGRLILSETFYAGDDFWFVIWNGKSFDFRYAGEQMR